MAGSRPIVELALVANNVEVLNKRDFARGNQITTETLNLFKSFWRKTNCIDGGAILMQSVCPNIFQQFEVKLGLLLCLIGGVPESMNEIKIRGQIHMLMVGEPGTGKSQLLRSAA